MYLVCFRAASVGKEVAWTMAARSVGGNDCQCGDLQALCCFSMVCAVAGTNVFPPSAREAPTWLPALGLLELVSPYVDLLSPF